ncbi:MAG: MGMT family protein [Candidatus Paceibacterota bacterium]
MRKITFKERVLKIVKKIKKGKVLTYKQVAQLAGSKNAWRAVGNILKNNKDKNIPCHRVIRSDGTLGGYNQGVEKKKELLLKEGVLQKLNLKKTKKEF